MEQLYLRDLGNSTDIVLDDRHKCARRDNRGVRVAR
jgi:hypothetical protein